MGTDSYDLTAEQVVQALSGARFFRRMSPAELKRFVVFVFDASTEEAPAVRGFEEDEIVFERGDESDAMYVVLEGRFEEMTDRPDRGGTPIWPLDRGAVFGEVALFAQNPDGAAGAGAAGAGAAGAGAAGAGSAADQPRRRTFVRCQERGRVFVVRQAVAEEQLSDEGFARAMLRSVATDALQMFHDEREFDLVAQSYFDGPTGKLVPAPYRCDRTEIFVTYGRAPRGEVASFLPPGLQPIPGFEDLFLLVVGRFPRFRQPDRPEAIPFDYDETTFFVPCLATVPRPPWVFPAVYTPALYPDSHMAVLLGREIFGFPKRLGQTRIERPRRSEDGELVRGGLRLEVDGVEALTVRYDRDDAPLSDFWSSAPGPLPWFERAASGLGLDTSGPGLTRTLNKLRLILPQVPVVTLKQIPGPGHRDGVTRNEVNELTLSPFLIMSLGEMSAMTGVDLRIGGRVPFAGATAWTDVGVRVVFDMELNSGRVLRRFRRHFEPIPVARDGRGPLSRAWGALGLGRGALADRLRLLRSILGG